jgi:hypothetical protein
MMAPTGLKTQAGLLGLQLVHWPEPMTAQR